MGALGAEICVLDKPGLVPRQRLRGPKTADAKHREACRLTSPASTTVSSSSVRLRRWASQVLF